MPAQPSFDKSLFSFLRALKKNNERDWFKANKPRYQAQVRDPALDFIAEFGTKIQGFAPHIVADPRPVGGSLFRIHRDTRFGKDKTPYKTHVGIHFRHEVAKDAHAPGYYLHLEPGNVFMGAGIWRPDGPTVKMIREAIVEEPGRYKKITKAKVFRESWKLSGDALKRPPRGFDAEHELVEELKRKDFIAIQNLKDNTPFEAGFLNDYVKACKSAKNWMAFLTEAIGLPF
jgi:uncharacterized protein (TIGR02453 family)